jgi:transposase
MRRFREAVLECSATASKRCLRDLPWQGRMVQIQIRVRRFRCLNPYYCRSTFAEPLIGIAARSARRTTRLAEIQRSVALATGGEPGARLARRLAIPVSPDTLLRLILHTPAPPRPTRRFWGWTIGRIARATATAPSWSISRRTRSSTCCRTAKL